MASSSDWIEALKSDEALATATLPAWADAFGQGREDGFVEGFPFAGRAAREAAAEEHETASVCAAPDTASSAEPDADPVADAFERGFATGREQAREELEAEYEAKLSAARQLRLAFQDLDQAAMDELALSLAETVVSLCAETIADYVPDPERLHARCESAAARLGSAASACALHLHPDDLTLLDTDLLARWETKADPSVERGGLLFEGPDGSIADGPVEWRRAIAAAICG